MYRQATPPTHEDGFEVLLVTYVSIADGRVAVPLLGTLALVPVLFFVGTILRGPVSDIAPYAAALPISAAAGALAAFIRKRRLRKMTIERHGDEVVLAIERTRIRLSFPLRLLGEQQTYAGRITSHCLYLQAVGQDGASVIFLEQRGSRSGREAGWLSDGVDRTLAHTEIDLDDPTVMSIVELRETIERANASLREAARPDAAKRHGE